MPYGWNTEIDSIRTILPLRILKISNPSRKLGYFSGVSRIVPSVVETRETHAACNDIVLKGTRADKGMASFASLLKPEDVEAIHAYVISRANEDWGTGGHAY